MTVSVPSRFETEHVPNLRQKRSRYDEIIHVKVAIILYRTYYKQEAVYVQRKHWDTCVKPLLPWESNKYYTF
jgi:hypothetical protein